MNLFSRLYKYKESDNRSQLENFCTEGLCDLLNRCTEEQQYKLFDALDISFIGDEKIVWETQYSIKFNGGYRAPDLVGRAGNSIRYLIEVKIDAPFTNGVDSEGKEVHQLEIYDRWLSENKVGDNAFLILLTYKTKAPEGFANQCLTIFRTIYWQNIYDCFEHISNISHLHDYRHFLKEKELAVDMISHEDILALKPTYEGSGERLEQLMTNVFKQLNKKYNDENYFDWSGGSKTGCAKISQDGAMNWSWVYLKLPSKVQYFYWGVQFPHSNIKWDISQFITGLSSPQFVFGYCINDSKENAEKVIEAFKKKDYIVGKPKNNKETTIFHNCVPMEDFLKDNCNVNTFVDWISKEMEQALDIIKASS